MFLCVPSSRAEAPSAPTAQWRLEVLPCGEWVWGRRHLASGLRFAPAPLIEHAKPPCKGDTPTLHPVTEHAQNFPSDPDGKRQTKWKT